MAYELNLRPGASGLESDAILGKLCGSLGLIVPEGDASPAVATVEFWEGGTRGGLRQAPGEQGVLGADLLLPYGAVVAEIEACLRRVLEAADEQALVVFDPQLGSAVTRGELARIIERYGEDSAYHVHHSGTAEDRRQGFESAEDASPYKQPGATVQMKVLLGLVLLLLLSWLFFRACVISPMVAKLEGEEAARIPRTGPPPGWLARHPPTLEPAPKPEPTAAPEAAAKPE